MKIIICCLLLASCGTNKYSTNKTKQKVEKIINSKKQYV